MAYTCLEGESESRPWRASRETCGEPAVSPYGLCRPHVGEWQAHTGPTDADPVRALDELQGLGR